MSYLNFAVLLCKFKDDQSEPRPRKFYEMLFTHVGVNDGNLPAYFRDISHNHVDMNYSQVFGPYVMDKNVSDFNRGGLMTWARDAATAGGADLTPFEDRIIVCINRALETYGSPNGAVLDDLGLEPYVAAQEILHIFGLGHARQKGQGDYTDPWDVMSAMSSRFFDGDPLYGRIGPITNAANMDHLGWLDPARVWQPAQGSSPLTITLRPLARPDLPGYVAAKIGEYYVEFRVREGWDRSPEIDPSVLVHTFEGNSWPDNHSYLMPAKSGRLALLKGDQFSSPHSHPERITIEVVDIDPIGRVATIRASRMSKQARRHKLPG